MIEEIPGIKYFKLKEFACPCCGEVKMQPTFIKFLDMARDIANVPFKITSGYRCPNHNKEIGGSPHSSHMKGWAADISAINSITRFKIINGFFEAYKILHINTHRFGIGPNFIHVDIDPMKPNNVIWTYYNH